MMDLNKLIDSGVLCVVNIPEDANLEYFCDIDNAEGYGGTDMILLEEERIVITKPGMAADVERMVEKSRHYDEDDGLDDDDGLDEV